MIKVSKTGENELLIHKSDGKGGHLNVIIDDDGDIELFAILKKQKDSWHKMNVSVDETIEFINQ